MGKLSGLFEHDADESDDVQVGEGLRQSLVVLDEAAEAGGPGEGALGDPTPGKVGGAERGTSAASVGAGSTAACEPELPHPCNPERLERSPAGRIRQRINLTSNRSLARQRPLLILDREVRCCEPFSVEHCRSVCSSRCAS